jgi:phosphoglycerate dehydrogenase-like enzyme
MSKPKILFTTTINHRERVFRKEVVQRIRSRFDAKVNESDDDYTAGMIASSVKGYDGLITGWGRPTLTDEVFKNADRLRIILNPAGSIKAMLPRDIVDKYIVPRKICVVSANHGIAYNVAESTIGMLIMASHRFIDHAIAIRTSGVWKAPNLPVNGQYLNGSTVGVVSASKVGREVIKLLRPFDLTILVYDPYLSEWEAGRLGVYKVGLDELFENSHFVTIHAPSIPATWGMIGERQFKKLKDGAVFVNTSRGKIVDHDALLRECKTGRIIAVLDVTDPEPLPPESPFRKLDNVIITPHISGAGYYGYFKIGDIVLESLENFFADKPVRDAVNFSNYDILA